MTSDKTIRLVGLASSLALYATALALPAFHFSNYRPYLTGYSVLGWGWWGVLSFNFAWFANPLLWAAWLAFWRTNNRRALSLSLWALLLSFQSFFAREWWFNEGSGTPIDRLGIGFYLWVAAIVAVITSSLLMRRREIDSPIKQGP